MRSLAFSIPRPTIVLCLGFRLAPSDRSRSMCASIDTRSCAPNPSPSSSPSRGSSVLAPAPAPAAAAAATRSRPSRVSGNATVFFPRAVAVAGRDRTVVVRPPKCDPALADARRAARAAVADPGADVGKPPPPRPSPGVSLAVVVVVVGVVAAGRAVAGRIAVDASHRPIARAVARCDAWNDAASVYLGASFLRNVDRADAGAEASGGPLARDVSWHADPARSRMSAATPYRRRETSAASSRDVADAGRPVVGSREGAAKCGPRQPTPGARPCVNRTAEELVAAPRVAGAVVGRSRGRRRTMNSWVEIGM